VWFSTFLKYILLIYRAITFLPLNLFDQFRKKANFYFLIIAILSFTPYSPKPPFISITPLVFVLGVSAIKEAWEYRVKFLIFFKNFSFFSENVSFFFQIFFIFFKFFYNFFILLFENDLCSNVICKTGESIATLFWYIGTEISDRFLGRI